ncbi:hypothetical protein D3C83_233330 [compost metagenome]
MRGIFGPPEGLARNALARNPDAMIAAISSADSVDEPFRNFGGAQLHEAGESLTEAP